MLSVAAERPLQPAQLALLRLVTRVARDIGLDYFLIGAIARDIILYHVFDQETGRATFDVDLAVAVDSWPEFEAFKTRLIGTAEVTDATQHPHRLVYRAGSEARAHYFDLLPFGGLKHRPGEIAWPPDLSVVMSVSGYPEALAAAEHVDVGHGLVVRVASLPSLAALKLLAWNDRGLGDTKDAHDFAILLRSYCEAGNEDRLYGTEFPLLEALGHDIDLAGPRLLGKDTARVIAPSTRAQLIALLGDARRRARLARDMAREYRLTEDPVADAEARIAQFMNGLESAPAPDPGSA
jgi:predicted nucleotidyltransferase